MPRYGDIRKVQSIKDSYLVYLPKEWCKRNEVDRGSEVSILDLGDILLIVPRRNQQNVAKISLDGLSPEEIEVYIYAFYVAGFDRIELVKEASISLDERYFIRSLIKRLLGMEIVHEEANKLILGEVMSPGDISSLILRSFQLVGLAMNYLLSLLDGTGRPEIIGEAEEEVDRFFFAVQRRAHRLTTSPSDAAVLGLLDRMNYVQMMKYLERISDHIKELAFEIAADGTTLPKRFVEDVIDLYNRCLQAFTEKSAEKAFNVIRRRQTLRERLLREVSNKTVLMHLTRIVDYVSDISEVVLDMTLRSRGKVGIEFAEKRGEDEI